MATRVAELMSKNPICVRADRPVSDAAQQMADSGVGSVLVVDGDQVVGMCTDRDITVRVTAARLSPATTVREACSDHRIHAVDFNTSIVDAADLMAEHAVSRLPVTRNHELVGIVTLADLARDKDLSSASGAISEAVANR